MDEQQSSIAHDSREHYFTPRQNGDRSNEQACLTLLGRSQLLEGVQDGLRSSFGHDDMMQ
jgi:hypothetical protein